MTGENHNSLIKEIRRLGPSIVLGIGQSRLGSLIRIERVAKQIYLKGKRLIEKGPQKYYATLKIKNIQNTRISYNAGKHYCNYTFYMLLKNFGREPKIGFLHIPKYFGEKKAVSTVRKIIASIQHNNI